MIHLFNHHLDLGDDISTSVRTLPAHGGVYLIADPDDKPVLLASGENLRRVVGHRLAAPPPNQKTRRAHLAEVAASVHWRETFSRFETALTHYQLARILDPRAYRKTIAFPPAWFLRVDVQARVPRFSPLRVFPADGARYIGPFATGKDADEWVHMLVDLFDLCRDNHVLEQSPHGQACAYFDMGRCPAPCDGTVSLEAYRRTIAEAVAFSVGDREPRPAVLRDSMDSAAKALAFERAAALRQTIERAAAAIKKREYAPVADLSDCCWLILQRGGPARRSTKNSFVKPFFVRCGTIEVGGPVALPDIASVIPRWLAGCGPCSVLPPDSAEEQTTRCEVLWLVAKFLFQAERAPGLFYRFDRLPDTAKLAAAVRAAFGPRQAGNTASPDTV